MPLAGIFPIPAVRSYVRRGRPTNSQRRALQQLRGRYVLAIDDISPVPARQSGLPDTTADWRTIFSRTAPLIADIGFGDGRATAALAAAHPECDHVAFEVHPPGVGALMNRLSSQKLQNVRIVQDDVSLMLPLLFTPNALSGVNIFFPDPWKKRRQHKRRLVDDTFIAMLAVYMAGGGVIHIATDNTDYAQSIAAYFAAQDAFTPLPYNEAEKRRCARPQTKFEARAIAHGRPIKELLYSKGRSDLIKVERIALKDYLIISKLRGKIA